MIKYVALTLLVVQNVTVMLTMHQSQEASTFIPSTAVVMQELLKLLLSYALLQRECAQNNAIDAESAVTIIRSRVSNVQDMLRLGVPGTLYLMSNNLLFISTKNLASSEVLLLMQLRILVTAILSVLVLRKAISKPQWIALMILFWGAILAEVPNASEGRLLSAEPNKMIGVAAVLCGISTSSFAGIYTEKLLKDTQDSLWMRNIQLSLYGIFFGLCVCAVQDGGRIVKEGFFVGYSYSIVWAVILLNAAGGLLVALVLKYGDNVIKCFAVVISLVLTYALQLVIDPAAAVLPYFVPGSALVCLAVAIYSLYPAPSPIVGMSPDENEDEVDEFGIDLESYHLDEGSPTTIGSRRDE